MENTVLLIHPTIQPVGVEILERNCRVLLAPDGREDTLIEYINKNRVRAVVTRVESISRRIIESCECLDIVAQHGVGLDNIDVEAATDNGVMVLNVPDANFVSVAEHAMMSVLALSRNLLMADKNVRMGNWQFRENKIPMEIAGKRLMIVGLGMIGRDVAKKALCFDMSVTAFDAYVSGEKMAELGVTKALSLMDALSEADFVTLHAPATAETRHMISAPQLKAMKKTAGLINLARGPLIDEAALYRALVDGEIAGAALDVFEEEPPVKSNPLLTLDNVIVTPHIGGDTLDSKLRCSKKLAEAVVQALRGESPYNWFNRRAMEDAQ